MNFSLTRWKRKRRILTENIEKDQYVPFLKQVDKSIKDLVRDFPDQNMLTDRIGKEVQSWLKDMPKFNSASFKAGICYGIFAYSQELMAKDKPKKEFYVS